MMNIQDDGEDDTDPVKECHDGNSRSHARAGGQQIQEESEISVVVVDIIQVTKNLALWQTSAVSSLQHVVLVRWHDSTQLAKTWEEEPECIVDVAEDVEDGDGAGEIESVDVEGGGVAVTLVVEAVNIADDGVRVLEDGDASPEHVDQ